MGANLVGRAFAFAVDVPLQPNEFRLLLGMCLTALDTDEHPRYFDSREASALFLGRRVPDAGAERDAAFQRVKIATRGLIAIGAINRTKQGGNGRRAEFEIVLDSVASLSTAEARKRTAGVRRTTPSGVRRTTQLGYVERPVGGRRTYPSGIEEPQEPREEIQVTNATTSPGPVDNSQTIIEHLPNGDTIFRSTAA